MINFIEYNNLGSLSDEAPVSVDSAAAIAYTITAGKKGVSFQNVGSKVVWYGGINVNPATSRGHKLVPMQVLSYRNTKNTFKIYFKCESGDTSTIGVINYS